MKRTAFTLVELLVVIGIIAVLIGILLPALSRARDSANTVKCLGNLRQLGQLAQLYANENKGCLLPVGQLVVRGNTVDSNGQNAENYATILVNAGYVSVPAVPSMSSGPMVDKNVFYCPSGVADYTGITYSGPLVKPFAMTRQDMTNSSPWRTQSASTQVIIDTWYGMNGDWGTNATSPFPSHFQPDTNNSYAAWPKAGTIPHSGDMVLLYDGTFYDLNFDANRVSARHNRRKQTNILFFDGHAATFDTASLPGGIGDANGGMPPGGGGGIFDTPKLSTLRTFDTPIWRLDQAQ